MYRSHIIGTVPDGHAMPLDTRFLVIISLSTAKAFFIWIFKPLSASFQKNVFILYSQWRPVQQHSITAWSTNKSIYVGVATQKKGVTRCTLQ